MIKHLFTPLRELITDSRSVGILLLICTIISLSITNMGAPISIPYIGFWQSVPIEVHTLHLPLTVNDWINECCMTLFFFVVGSEIKQSILGGELAGKQKAQLPIIAAIGGMLLPALLFICINPHLPFRNGWGIPMATDIAFSLGILSLLGKRIPIQLKIFLTALAIIDDLGAVVAIAVFYTATIHWWYVLAALLLKGGSYYCSKKPNVSGFIYPVIGVLVWYCVYNSGIHATIAGVLMAMAMPIPILKRIEHLLFVPTNYIILPLFALANTAIVLPNDWSLLFRSNISLGVLVGLIVGKPLGIVGAIFLSVRLKWIQLPENIPLSQLIGIGLLGGIGFTMSLFIVNLAYQDSALQLSAKVAVLVGSLVAGILGYFYLKFVTRANT